VYNRRSAPRNRGRRSTEGSGSGLGANGRPRSETPGRGSESGWVLSTLLKKLPELMTERPAKYGARKPR